MEKKNETQPKQEKKNPGAELALLKKNIIDSVMERVQPLLDSKEIRLPENYSIGNAMHSAWFVLLETKNKEGNSVLQTCTRESIANALFKMSIWGLSVAKKQVAFIAYGNQLTCQTEYPGSIALARRYGGVDKVNPGVIYKNDVFKYSLNIETGRKKITEHSQELENINDDQIRGAYCVLTFTDKSEPYVEIMSIEQIKKAWLQGAAKGASPAHKNFAGEMSKKTVISRACKLFINSSDDAALFDDDDTTDLPREARDTSVTEKGNKKEIDTKDVDFVDVTNTPETPQDQIPPEGPVEEQSSLSELGTENQEEPIQAPY